MLFYIGFIIMILNEGFVILRHGCPWAARKREYLLEKYGKKWKNFHSAMDISWVTLVALGLVFSGAMFWTYVAALGLFWGVVGIYYLVIYRKKLLDILTNLGG